MTSSYIGMVCVLRLWSIYVYVSEYVHRCTTDVEKWYEVYDSVFAYLMNGWKTEVSVGVASYSSVDEWIDVGGGSLCINITCALGVCTLKEMVGILIVSFAPVQV